MRDLTAALDAAGAPKANAMGDSSSSESSSDSSSEATTAGDDSDVDMGQVKPHLIQSFTAKQRDDLKRAEKLKAKSQKLSSKKLRLEEAQAKAFLIKTIDDQHVIMLKVGSDLWLPAALSQWTFDALEGKLFSAAHLAGRLAPLRASAKRSGGAHNLTRTTEYSISRLNATQKWNTCMVVGLYSGLRFKMLLRIFKTAPITSSGPDARVGRLRSVLTTASGLNSYLKD
ncbi:hypothetical protein PC123_g10864 [Phytophthora cactorum]|nr:hypothetical protein PC123_g10864 [Phytophthora cactorum]